MEWNCLQVVCSLFFSFKCWWQVIACHSSTIIPNLSWACLFSCHYMLFSIKLGDSNDQKNVIKTTLQGMWGLILIRAQLCLIYGPNMNLAVVTINISLHLIPIISTRIWDSSGAHAWECLTSVNQNNTIFRWNTKIWRFEFLISTLQVLMLLIIVIIILAVLSTDEHPISKELFSTKIR